MGYDSRDYYRPGGYGGFSMFPTVLKNIIIINVIVFIIQTLFETINIGGYPGWFIMNHYFALNPLGGFIEPGIESNFQVWQLITYQFMHADFWHIFWNMFILWMFGTEIANIFGEKKFLLFYLLSGIGGGILHLILDTGSGFTIGASGAVYGVMIAFGMFFPNRLVYIYFILPVRTKYMIGFMIIMDVLLMNKGTNTAHLAHIGGAITGAIFVFLDKKHNFNFSKLFSFKRKRNPNEGFRRPFSYGDSKVDEAKFYDINAPKQTASQEEIDRILDKISKSGYQNLTEEEKRTLFEASKRG